MRWEKKIKLPKASTGDETQKTTLALTLAHRPSGGYDLYANGDKISELQLRTMLPALLGKNHELQVIIAADKSISYGDVVHIVDLVKALGVHKFALNTDPTS